MEAAIFNPGRSRRKRRMPPRSKSGRFMKRGGRRSSRRRRRSNPMHAPILPNRARRRRSGGRKSYRRNILGPRRNPRRFDFAGFMRGTLTPSLIGAGGAIGLDMILAKLPLPAPIKAGPFRPVVRIAGAIGLGMIGGMVLGRRMGEQLTAGAVTVVLYDTLKGFLKPMFPALGVYDDMVALGYQGSAVFSPDMGQIPAIPAELIEGGVGDYDDTSMGVYDPMTEMGVYTQ